MKSERLPGRLPLPASRGYVELAEVSLVEDDRRLLVDVSVALETGSTNYVLGPSPEERSALLRLLLGVESPTTGVLRIDGSDLRELPLATARDTIALALSDPWLTSGSIADNIAFGHRGLDREQIVRAAKLACVDSFTDEWELGIDTVVSEEAPELTVGQRRLVALARAVVRQPAVLLIDEPTRGLDAQEETIAIKALRRVARGRTTLVAAHRLHYAGRPDRLLRLERGRLVEDPAAPPDAPVAPDAGWPGHRASRRLDASQPVGALTDDPDSTERTGTGPIVDGFQTVRLLERSSYSETWLAWDESDSNRVQLKLARRRNPVTYAALEELSQEYRTAESLRHPGLPRPITADFGGPNPHAVYEYVNGHTLAALIDFHGPNLPPELVLRVGYELARILSYIHQRGYTHLDLRPEIVMLTPFGTLITDLKMVRPKGAETKRIYRQDQFGVVAAEQLRGRPAAESMDLFALGAVLYQASNGLLAADWPGTLNSHRRLTSASGSRPALPHSTAGTGTGHGRDRAAAAEEAGGPATDRARATTDASLAAQATLDDIIERLTTSDPAQRPRAEEALSLLQTRVPPAPVANPALGPGDEPRPGRPQLNVVSGPANR